MNEHLIYNLDLTLSNCITGKTQSISVSVTESGDTIIRNNSGSIKPFDQNMINYLNAIAIKVFESDKYY